MIWNKARNCSLNMAFQHNIGNPNESSKIRKNGMCIPRKEIYKLYRWQGCLCRKTKQQQNKTKTKQNQQPTTPKVLELSSELPNVIGYKEN